MARGALRLRRGYGETGTPRAQDRPLAGCHVRAILQGRCYSVCNGSPHSADGDRVHGRGFSRGAACAGHRNKAPDDHASRIPGGGRRLPHRRRRPEAEDARLCAGAEGLHSDFADARGGRRRPRRARLSFRKAEKWFFEPLKETQRVYSKPFRITQPITLTRLRRTVTINGTSALSGLRRCDLLRAAERAGDVDGRSLALISADSCLRSAFRSRLGPHPQAQDRPPAGCHVRRALCARAAEAADTIDPVILASALFLGFLHGLGADHLMAIAALSVGGAAETAAVRRTRALGVAVRFAFGHALLLALGAAALLALGWSLPIMFERAGEVLGGVLLIVLGRSDSGQSEQAASTAIRTCRAANRPRTGTCTSAGRSPSAGVGAFASADDPRRRVRAEQPARADDAGAVRRPLGVDADLCGRSR